MNRRRVATYTRAPACFPYLGNDQAGGGPVPVRGVPSTYPYLVSEKGTTTEGGFVSGDYGEQGSIIYNWGQITGDAQLQARALEVLRARAPFRIPLPDSSGYRIMYVAEPIGNRNNGLPGHVAYLSRGVGSDLDIAAQGVNVVGADIVGYVQQQMSEGQMLQAIASDNGSSLNIPDDYAAVKAMAQTGVKLPMTPGQPDYAWADEQNMVVAAKHGNETLFVNLLWHNPSAITQGAMVFDITPQTTRMAEVKVDDVRFDFSGGLFRRLDYCRWIRGMADTARQSGPCRFRTTFPHRHSGGIDELSDGQWHLRRRGHGLHAALWQLAYRNEFRL